MARSLTETPRQSGQLPQSQLDGCKVCASRYAMLECFPKGGVAAELGTYCGDFAREILNRAAPRELHLIDITYAYFDATLRSDPRVVCHEGLTDKVIATFADDSFDWIYIDADHSYAGVLRDARASAPKVRPGGLLVFNDFAHVDAGMGRYGVHRAATEFALECGWKMRYFAMDAWALYDIALEKPSR